jgi:tRNA uridine 5-carboxymethylaminomethyl modification enzyme
MFTSRAEFRLSLRCDNADLRLTPIGIAAGCVGPARRAAFDTYSHAVTTALAQAEGDTRTPQDLASIGLHVKADGQRRGALDLLGRDYDQARINAAFPWMAQLEPRVREQVEIGARYHGYLQRQHVEARQMRASDAVDLPTDIDYSRIGGLSTEMRERLGAARPPSIGALSRIPGITPPAVMAVIGYVRSLQGSVSRETAA